MTVAKCTECAYELPWERVMADYDGDGMFSFWHTDAGPG
jgi:hypothetical protein